MYQKHILPSGLRVITVPQKTAQSVTVLVVVGAGSKYETRSQSGISHFLEHMFFKGTKKRPSALKVAETLDKIGGIYNAFTSKEYTGYFAKVEQGHFNLALEWVSDIFLNSKIPEAEINRERGVIIEEIKMYQDMPMQDVENVWEELLYGDTPAGRKVIGTKENIQAFKRADLMDYHQKHYSAHNTIVCLSGNFDESQAPQLVEKYFKVINSRDCWAKERVQEHQTESQVKVQFKETDQTHFCLGVRGFSLAHRQKYIQEILAIILGGNMSSRLFIEVRERRGLAYYIHTTSETYTDSGFLVTQAGVAHQDLLKAVKLILKEYQAIARNGVKAAELKKAQDYLKGALALSLESSDALASYYGGQELLTGHILTLAEKIDIINKIKATEVQAAAREIFQPDRLNLALIGPHAELAPLKKALKV